MIPNYTLDNIIEGYVFTDEGDGFLHIDADELWDTDDLIELGVIINKILRERQENGQT